MKIEIPQMRELDDDHRDPQTYEIIGAAMAVHKNLGPGFMEAVYQEALAIEMQLRAVPFARETPLPIMYRGQILACAYRADFICYEEIIVELKAIERLTNIEYAQVLNYLKATGLQRALLFNFSTPRLDYRRLVFTA
jgi:GxxExxY protein